MSWLQQGLLQLLLLQISPGPPAFLRHMPLLPHGCRAPSVRANPTGPNKASVVVMPPAVGEPWGKFRIEVCPTSGPAAGDCRNVDCSPVAALPASTTCPLGDLTEETAYRVRATAVKSDGIMESLISAQDSFTTPAQSYALPPCVHACGAGLSVTVALAS